MPARWHARLSPATRGALLYFGFFGAAAVYMPFFTVFLSHRGLTGREIGLLTAIGPLMALLLAPALAALADGRGWRVRMLTGGLLSIALLLLVLPLPASFIAFLPVVTLLAVLSSPVGPLMDGLVVAMATRHGLAFGKMRFWGSVSWAVIAVGSGAIWQAVGFGWMFPVASLLVGGTVLVAQLLPEDPPAPAHARPPMRAALRDRSFRALLGASFLLGLAMALVGAFAGIYLDRLGGQSLVGLFAGVTALCELPTMHWSQRIADRLGGRQALLLAYSLLGLTNTGLALLADPAAVMALSILHGLGFGLYLPVTVRLAAEAAPPAWATTYQGLMSAGSWGLAPLLAGPIGGLIYDSAGPPAVFLTGCGATLAAGGVLFLAGRAARTPAPLPAVPPDSPPPDPV
jgi:PPP family 3-phenylpropionic acid transporter